MTPSSRKDPSDPAKRHPPKAWGTRTASLQLVWAVTIGESILLGALAVALGEYWWMLPVWVRSVGALGLVMLAVLGVVRVVRFYRQRSRLRQTTTDVP